MIPALPINKTIPVAGNITILIVEDEFIVANDLRLMLNRAGYQVVGIASSVEQARRLIDIKKPDWLLLDIMLKGDLTGIDLAKELYQKKIPFLYISANTNQSILEQAKATQPYGFLVKPFREKDLFVMLDIALYRYSFDAGLTMAATTLQTAEKPILVEGIVGNSPALQRILHSIQLVAPTGTSVLVLGESGTGKESIAKAVHQHSPRKAKPLITVNCAALPLALIESELFGHERGAFTGANTRRIGKFEQANGGTLFLDEIGELPLDAQVKLLRALQEKEIERLGSDSVIKTDVRIVAATNRNLEKEVAEGRFRLDLYYRLNVFPIKLPPLRERKKDIPILAEHFIHKYAHKAGRAAPTIAPAAMQQLEQYNWPGNIRELEHLMERYVLLATGNIIETFNLSISTRPLNDTAEKIVTLENLEREHILKALKACSGKVSGEGGAALLLNIPTQTLYAKMKKLGIQQEFK